MASAALQINITAQEAASAPLEKLHGAMGGIGDAASKAGKPLSELGSHVEGAGHKAEEAEPHFAKLKEGLADVGKIAAGMVAGGVLTELTSGLGEQFGSIVGQTSAWGEQVRLLSQNLGVSSEDASTLALAMKDVGIGGDQGLKAMDKFAKGLGGVEDTMVAAIPGAKTTLQAVKDLGIEVDEAGGKQKPFIDILGDLADKFKEMPDGVAKTTTAMSLFGKTGTDMIPLLNLGKEGLKEVEEEAKKYGLQLSAGNVQDIRKFALAHNEMDAAVEGAKLQIGTAMMPVLTALTGTLTESVVHVRGWIDAFAKTEVFETLKVALSTVGEVLGKVVDMVKALAKGDANSFFLAITEGAAKVGLDVTKFRDVFLQLTSLLFGTVPAAVGATVDALKHIWEALEPVRQKLSELSAAHPEVVFAAIGVAVAAMLGPIALVTGAALVLKMAWDSNLGDIQGKIQAFWGFVQPILQAIGTELARFWTEIQPRLVAAWDAISNKVREVWDFIWNNVLQPGLELLASFWQAHWDSIRLVLVGVWDLIKSFVQVQWDIITGIFKVALDVLSGNWTQAWADIQATVSSVMGHVVDVLTNILPSMGAAAAAIGGAIKDGIVGALGDFGAKLTGALSDAINAIHIDIGPFHLSANGFTIDAPQMPSFSLPSFGLNMGVASGGGGGGGGTPLPFGPAQNPEHKPFETPGGQPTESPSNGGVPNTPTGFASGGSFVVGGSGGVDTNLVRFMATRGERVTITPSGGGGGQAGMGALVAAIQALADRPISLAVDGRELARAVRENLLQLGSSENGLGLA